MLIAFSEKNEIGFINGLFSQPLDGDPQYLVWHMNDIIVASWLLYFVSKELTANIIYSSTAGTIWKDLWGHFLQNNDPHLFQLCKDFIIYT
ncbi:unnamed protein product [Vicia faba]|uniref:Uncharacterized protein n=1 Tax=Vicia faba TaxID=3906 RepID=A0AAV0Z574_VICFA|nr:unnamed protein product [Vicia faba]